MKNLCWREITSVLRHVGRRADIVLRRSIAFPFGQRPLVPADCKLRQSSGESPAHGVPDSLRVCSSLLFAEFPFHKRHNAIERLQVFRSGINGLQLDAVSVGKTHQNRGDAQRIQFAEQEADLRASRVFLLSLYFSR